MPRHPLICTLSIFVVLCSQCPCACACAMLLFFCFLVLSILYGHWSVFWFCCSLFSWSKNFIQLRLWCFRTGRSWKGCSRGRAALQCRLSHDKHVELAGKNCFDVVLCGHAHTTKHDKHDKPKQLGMLVSPSPKFTVCTFTEQWQGEHVFFVYERKSDAMGTNCSIAWK